MEDLILMTMALVIALLAIQVVKLRRALNIERAHRLSVETQMQRMDGEIAALTRGAVGLGQRVVGLEGHWRETKEQQERLEMSHGKERQFDHALRLIHGGAGVDEILSKCDFTRSEAELMLKMNQFQRTG